MTNQQKKIENREGSNFILAHYSEGDNYIDLHKLHVHSKEMSKEKYNKLFEDFLPKLNISSPKFTICTACDTSGYDYWTVQQKEDNFICISVSLEVPAENLRMLDIDYLCTTIEYLGNIIDNVNLNN